MEQSSTDHIQPSHLWKAQLIPTAGLLRFVILLCREAEVKFKKIKIK